MADYQGKKVVIIGLGLTGLSCVDFFLARGVTPRVMDTRVSPPGLDKLPEQVERHLGGLNDDWLLAADLIVASPGMALAHPSLSAAADAGVEIVGDIELFCREAQAPIVAITGSNGKSTVTTLVGEMAKAAGMNVGVGGNIGLPALMLLDQGCDIFIATAAVADYRVAQVAEHKIKKAGDELNVALVKNPDIVATIAQQAKRPFMVGFAAETRNVEEYAAGKLVAKKLDMIACNDVSRADIGFASDENAMIVFFAEQYQMQKRDLDKAPKQEIAQQLVEAIHDALHHEMAPV